MLGRLNSVAHLLDVLCRGIALSVGVAVLVMVGVISYGVVARELLHLSDVRVTEVTTYLMAYMTFVGTAALAWQTRHLKVDVISHLFVGSGRRAVSVLGCAIGVAVTMVIAALSIAFWSDAWTSGERSWGMFSIPLWIPYLSLLIGSLLLAFVQLTRLVTLLFAGAENGHDTTGDTVQRNER